MAPIFAAILPVILLAIGAGLRHAQQRRRDAELQAEDDALAAWLRATFGGDRA